MEEENDTESNTNALLPAMFADDCFPEDFADFFDEAEFNENELHNCNLSPEELDEFLNPPSVDKWEDYLSTDNPTFVTINSSKAKQWNIAKSEIAHVRNRLKELISENDELPNRKEILFFLLGPESDVGMFLKKELELTNEDYLNFISTICVQSAYRVSSTELFDKASLLKGSLNIDEASYNKMWRVFAEKKKVSQSSISTSRREQPIWASLEHLVNVVLREISITGRDGEISIALDDDKVWVSQTNSASTDLFDLKYTTHVKPNRKGIVGHTAVSTGANIPLGIVLEKTHDSTLSCFKRLLNFLFRNDSNSRDRNAFRNIIIHSDRGYMVPKLVYEFLMANGANVVGTVKRMAGCWPFTFNQNVRESDQRTKIDPKGAPTLFLKWWKGGSRSRGGATGEGATRKLFASAFRNGTQSVATAISSIHSHHHWEGIAMVHSELCDYQKDKKSLRPKFFQRIDDLFENEAEDDEKDEMMKILDEDIEPITLRQGKKSFFITHLLFECKIVFNLPFCSFIQELPIGITCENLVSHLCKPMAHLLHLFRSISMMLRGLLLLNIYMGQVGEISLGYLWGRY